MPQASPGPSWVGSARRGGTAPQVVLLTPGNKPSLWQLPPPRYSLSAVPCVPPCQHGHSQGPLTPAHTGRPTQSTSTWVTSRHRQFSLDKSLRMGPAWPCSQPLLSPSAYKTPFSTLPVLAASGPQSRAPHTPGRAGHILLGTSTSAHSWLPGDPVASVAWPGMGWGPVPFHP